MQMRNYIFRGIPDEPCPDELLDANGFVVGWLCPTPLLASDSPSHLVPCIYPEPSAKSGLWRPIKVDPLSISQSTGTKTECGQQVFGGDILAVPFDPQHRAETMRRGLVEWDGFGWVLRWGPGDYDTSRLDPSDLYDGKVIGNIVRNPELLGW